MKRTFCLILAATLLAGCATKQQAATDDKICQVYDQEMAKAQPSITRFGAEPKLSEADAVAVETVLAKPAEYNGKYVRMDGMVRSVCEKKGCWLRIAPSGAKPGDADVFVKFPDPPEGRLIPMSAVGHRVSVEGTVKNGTMSEAAARHFKHDAGASQAEIDQIVGPQPQVSIAGPAVAIEGIASNSSQNGRAN